MNRRTFFGGVTAGVLTGVGAVNASIVPVVDDEPTYVTRSGTKVWRNQYGEFHRIGGPATIHSDGIKEWWVNGQYHRLDGPAVVYPDGRRSWYENGQRHRIDGPAMIWTDGEYWYEDDELHRVGGPAIIRANGTKEWYENGQRIKYE